MSARWRELTDAQRLQWNRAAEDQTVPGWSHCGTGHLLYCGINSFLLSLGQASRTTPPGGRAPALLTFTQPVQVPNTGTFTTSSTWSTSPTSRLLVRATQPLPPQLARSRNPAFRLILQIGGSSYSGLLNWAFAWFPGNPASYAGLQITWEARAWTLSGLRSPIVRRSTILA